MRTVLLTIVAIITTACGGNQSTEKRVVPYDPALSELCYDSAEPAKQVCEREVDNDGKKTMISPRNASDEMKRYRRIKKLDSSASRSIASQLISRGERAYKRNLICEGQVARFERGMSYMKSKSYREAFVDFAFIASAGPHHFKYEEMAVHLKRLKPFMAGGTTAPCLAKIYNHR